MELNKKIKKAEHLVIDELDDEIIIFNEKTENTHILNQTAGFIFKAANEVTILQLINKLCDSFSKIADNEVFNDVKQVLEEMIKYELVELYE